MLHLATEPHGLPGDHAAVLRFCRRHVVDGVRCEIRRRDGSYEDRDPEGRDQEEAARADALQHNLRASPWRRAQGWPTPRCARLTGAPAPSLVTAKPLLARFFFKHRARVGR